MHAIAETFRALDQATPARGYGIGLAHEECEPIGKALGVPALFIELLNYEGTDETALTEPHVEQYIAWRRRLAAGRAVA